MIKQSLSFSHCTNMVIFITDFHQKAEFFNCFFAKQCSISQNSSKLPTNLSPRKYHLLTSINLSLDNVLRIIQNLNQSQAQGRDKISIRMVKTCGNSLCRPVEMIFTLCNIKEEFPFEQKKANVDPAHKKVRSIVKELQAHLIAGNF